VVGPAVAGAGGAAGGGLESGAAVVDAGSAPPHPTNSAKDSAAPRFSRRLRAGLMGNCFNLLTTPARASSNDLGRSRAPTLCDYPSGTAPG